MQAFELLARRAWKEWREQERYHEVHDKARGYHPHERDSFLKQKNLLAEGDQHSRRNSRPKADEGRDDGRAARENAEEE